MTCDVQFVVLGVSAIQIALGTHVDTVQLHVIENFVHQEPHPECILMVAFVALVNPLTRVAIQMVLEASEMPELTVTAVALELLRLEVNLLDVPIQGFDVRVNLVTIVACLRKKQNI